MKKLLLSLILAATTMISAGSSLPQAPGHDWAQYEQGNALPLELYWYLETHPILLIHTMEDEDDTWTTMLMWIPDIGFNLIFDNRTLDVVTGQDDFGRPTFKAEYDSIPVSGLVDLTDSGQLMVEITLDDATAQVIVDGNGESGGEARECKCPFIGGDICVAADCQNAKVCWDSTPQKLCTWYKIKDNRSFGELLHIEPYISEFE